MWMSDDNYFHWRYWLRNPALVLIILVTITTKINTIITITTNIITNITTNMDTTICMSNLGRQVEDEDGEVEDADAGDDQVHNVEKGLSTDLQVEENIWRSSEHL